MTVGERVGEAVEGGFMLCCSGLAGYPSPRERGLRRKARNWADRGHALR